jgi:hypothetical protein
VKRIISLFAKNISGKNSKLSIQLKDASGKVFAEGVVDVKELSGKNMRLVYWSRSQPQMLSYRLFQKPLGNMP